jgi:hypothetical protein
MQIERWLRDRSPLKRAVVQVELGEVADTKAMARLLDGDAHNFGIDVELVGTTAAMPTYQERLDPEEPPSDEGPYIEVVKTIGESQQVSNNEIRYYEVKVWTD